MAKKKHRKNDAASSSDDSSSSSTSSSSSSDSSDSSDERKEKSSSKKSSKRTRSVSKSDKEGEEVKSSRKQSGSSPRAGARIETEQSRWDSPDAKSKKDNRNKMEKAHRHSENGNSEKHDGTLDYRHTDKSKSSTRNDRRDRKRSDRNEDHYHSYDRQSSSQNVRNSEEKERNRREDRRSEEGRGRSKEKYRRSEERHRRSEERHRRSEERHRRSEERYHRSEDKHHRLEERYRRDDKAPNRYSGKTYDSKRTDYEDRHTRDNRDNRNSYRSDKFNRNKRRRSRSSSFDHKNAKWGKDDDTQSKNDHAKTVKEKEKPNFALSGKLTEETNTFRGVVIKYSEPPEARKPKRRWRLYPFKGDKALQTLYIHRESAYLIGRERKVVDLPVDHPSCSKQHAVLQYRLVPFTREDGSTGKRVRPYLIDLDSANGTFINNKKIEPRRYVELFEKDVIKFGFSSREYVLLHENSKDERDDDDVKDEEIVESIKEEKV